MGYLCSTHWGWPSTFYLVGALAYCWSILWFYFGSNSPDEHSGISEEEKAYIKSTLSIQELEQVRTEP